MSDKQVTKEIHIKVSLLQIDNRDSNQSESLSNVVCHLMIWVGPDKHLILDKVPLSFLKQMSKTTKCIETTPYAPLTPLCILTGNLLNRKI